MFITGPGLYYKRIGVFTDVQWESKNTAFLRAQKDEFIQSQGDYITNVKLQINLSFFILLKICASSSIFPKYNVLFCAYHN
jgi:hypothetical protein